jgi:hypothetical protein
VAKRSCSRSAARAGSPAISCGTRRLTRATTSGGADAASYVLGKVIATPLPTPSSQTLAPSSDQRRRVVVVTQCNRLPGRRVFGPVVMRSS